MASVAKDRRHSEVRRVLEETITRRQFAQWAMGMCKREELSDDLARIHAAGVLTAPQAQDSVAPVLPG